MRLIAAALILQRNRQYRMLAFRTQEGDIAAEGIGGHLDAIAIHDEEVGDVHRKASDREMKPWRSSEEPTSVD
jgi:hypothetical protein